MALNVKHSVIGVLTEPLFLCIMRGRSNAVVYNRVSRQAGRQVGT